MSKNLERYYQAWKLRKQGLKLKEIGEKMGLSKERVRVMINYIDYRINCKFPPLPEEIRKLTTRILIKNKKQRFYEIAKLISNNFLLALLSKDTFRKLKNFNFKIKDQKLIHEWCALQILLMKISIFSFYKNNFISLYIFNFFYKFVLEELIKNGIFDSKNIASRFIKYRLNLYNKKISNKKDGLIFNISYTFCNFLNEKDILLLSNIKEELDVFLFTNQILIKNVESIIKFE